MLAQVVNGFGGFCRDNWVDVIKVMRQSEVVDDNTNARLLSVDKIHKHWRESFLKSVRQKKGVHTVKKQKSGRAIGEITASGLRNAIEVAKTTSVTRIIVLDDKVFGQVIHSLLSR